MGKWKRISVNGRDLSDFGKILNSIILTKYDKVYFKIFASKKGNQDVQHFYIADEGSEVVKALEEVFALEDDTPPSRKELKRVGGFSVDRDWMFS